MRVGYFDCFSGASGDMILGALIAAGLSPDDLRSDLKALNIGGYELTATDVRKQGFAAVRVEVAVTEKQPHRHLHHVTEIIEGSSLPPEIKRSAIRVFTRLAEAEARVHGTSVEKVHFHEVGAVDAIVDIVGAAIGFRRLGLDRIVCSPIPTGSGTVRCQHGVMPVPAPATAELLIGVPLAECDEPGELTTPTGAAILTTVASDFGSMPAMRIERNGFGAGSRDGRTRPNVLRLSVGEATADGGADGLAESDEVVVLEANLDDATGEEIGHAFDVLFAAGALDVFSTPITMKKSRPGVMLSAIVPAAAQAACEDALFRETTTFGVRHHRCGRAKLARSFDSVATAFGEIRVKIGRRGGRVLTISPEYEDCARASSEHGASLRDVMAQAEQAWRTSFDSEQG